MGEVPIRGTGRILVVLDPAEWIDAGGRALTGEGIECAFVRTAKDAVRMVQDASFAVAVVGLELPDADGIDLIGHLGRLDTGCRAVLFAGNIEPDRAIRAVRSGAHSIVSGRSAEVGLVPRVREAMAGRPMRCEGDLQGWRTRLGALLGSGSAMQSVFDRIERAASSSHAVLIAGEPGTGKGMVAQRIHLLGSRRDRPYIRISCLGAGPVDLSRRLFGFEGGANPGETEFTSGVLDLADAGTVFIEHIECMPDATAAALEDAVHGPPLNVRFISAATLTPAGPAVRLSLPASLWLDGEILVLPSLRERQDEIPSMAARSLGEACERMGTPPRRLAPEANELLVRHNWRGNLPELQSVMERAVLFSPGHEIGKAEIAQCLRPHQSARIGGVGGEEIDADAQLRVFLRRSGGSVDQAARTLGVSASWLKRRLDALRRKD